MKNYLFFLLFIPLFYLPCFISDKFCIILTREDGLYEYMGAFLFLLTAIIFVMLALSSKLYSNKNHASSKPKRIYFWCLAALFLFGFGEEISWGQRIFNFETPEFVRKANMQDEFNLHNLEIFHGRNVDGVAKKGLEKIITMRRLFYITFISYLFILPILFTANMRVRNIINKIGLPVPAISFGIIFIFNILFSKLVKYNFNEIVENEVNVVAEIKETLFALILFVLALSWVKFSNIRIREYS